jgi:5-oxoprolinase (ATP-hydrolysing) subunit A
MHIDLNCDMGESFGRYSLGKDADLMPLVSSANIACGLHAGDPSVMEATVRLAVRHGVRIGAHPGYPDLQGFGRRAMRLSPDEVEAFTLYQIGALAAFARAHGAELAHVKPHGALYNQAAQDRALANAVARAVQRFSRSLVLVGLAGSAMIDAAADIGLPYAREAFADRAYEADGSLRARALPGSLHSDPEDIARQAQLIARDRRVVAFTGEVLSVEADTLCLHGDHDSALANARAVRAVLEAAGITVRAPIAA